MAEAGKFLSAVAATVMLLQKAPRTQREVAELLDITNACTSRYFAALLAEGLIERTHVRPSGTGRRPRYYQWIKQ